VVLARLRSRPALVLGGMPHEAKLLGKPG